MSATIELRSLRNKFSLMVAWLLWGHVPLLLLVGWLNGRNLSLILLISLAMVMAYQISWSRYGGAITTRYIGAVAMVGLPAGLVFLLRGHAWQMDMHMYFFAMLALTIGWFDRRVIIFSALSIAAHHLLLLFLLPYAVFPSEASFERVLLHAAIVVVQSIVLVWVAQTVSAKFAELQEVSSQLQGTNLALKERTEEAEAANDTKSLFLANMSHEIRTPLNAVLGFCHLLQRTTLNSKQVDYVSKISSSGTALLRLINDILDYSKNEAGKLEFEIRPFSLQNAIEQQIQLVLGNAKAKGVMLHIQHDPRLPPILAGDELRLGQVILNLVNNAVKFTEQGSVTVRTQLITERGNRIRLGLDVIDTGIGMTDEQQARLFNSFSQADNTMTRRFGGTGLGLAIARQIVELMGGEISVSSHLGVGTTFSIALDLEKHSGALDDNPRLHPSLRGLRILAVDDNPVSRQIVREVFADWSVPIDTAAAADDALSRLEAASEVGKDYDLLILDWKMPGKDGLEVARIVRANPAIERKPKMVVLTAYGSDEFTSEVESSGIVAYLTKPLEPRALRDILQDLFLHPKLNAAQTPIALAPSADDLPQVQPELQGQRVLLVEDNEINREIATELLTDAGLLVDVAENGLLACEQVEREGDSYAVVLMDVQMPVMDGLDATRRIRRTWSPERLPIIAMTAHAYGEERQRCLDAGMNDHIAKPVEPPILVRTLNRYLKPLSQAQVAASAEVRGEVAAPASPRPAQRELPDHLPPFDIARALERVNGKRPLLLRLILSFAQTQADTANELRRLIASEEITDARRVSHTLKGLAGSLELPELQKVAAGLERALLSGEVAAYEPAIIELEDLLQEAVRAARSLEPEPVAQAAAVTSFVTLIPQEEFETRLNKLKEQLSKRSLGARSGFAEFAKIIGMNETTIEAHPVKKALEALDYDAALRELMNIKYET